MSLGKLGLYILVVACPAIMLISSAKADVIQPSVDCAACHETQYEQWEESSHALSQENPFYLAMLNRYKRDTGDKEGKYCQECHAPARYLAEEPNDALVNEGINCSVCHSIKDVTSTKEIIPFVMGDGKTQYSSERPGKKADESAHSVKLNRIQQRGTYCSGCHNQQHVTDDEIMVMNTWNEWKSLSRYSSNFIYCNQCHMEVQKDRDENPSSATGGVELRFKTPSPDDYTITHGFSEGTEAERMKSATRMKLTAESAYNEISFRVEVDMVNGGHTAPTGFYLNEFYYTVEAVDQNGEVILDDTQRFRKVLGDAEDNPVFFDWKATKVIEDTRIPGDGRKISNNYNFLYRKPFGEVTVTARLYYSKMPPELAKMLDLEYEPALLHEREWSYTP